MFKELDCGIVENKFELQSRYYAHFWTNTHVPPHPPNIVLNITTIVLLEGWITQEGWYAIKNKKTKK